MFVVRSVDGHPDPPETGKRAVEGRRPDGGPDADVGADGRGGGKEDASQGQAHIKDDDTRVENVRRRLTFVDPVSSE
jgi:hypothetical protein